MASQAQWNLWEMTVRRDLLVFAEHSSGAHQRNIEQWLRRWDEAKDGLTVLSYRDPVIYECTSRIDLLDTILECLQHAVITHTPGRHASLAHIIHDQCRKPLTQWPLVNLVIGDQRTPCTGFRNVRVQGGDGQQMEYYYFPEQFLKQYGRDAARTESEVRI